jgi:hypothetical protein
MDDVDDPTFIPVGGFSIEPTVRINFSVAQSFKPQKSVLTRVELYVGRNSTTTYDYVVVIRDNLTHEDLTQTSVSSGDIVVENFSWIEFDFEDIPVTIGETYYIVSYTANESDNWYVWKANHSNLYVDGCAWVSIDDGNTWTNDSVSNSANQQDDTWVRPTALQEPKANDTMDMCFKTYGRDNQPPAVTSIDGPASGAAGTEYDYTFIAEDPDGDDVFIYIDWGDNTSTGWIGPYESEEEVTESHTWEEQGIYEIKAKAKDIHGLEGDWSEPFVVEMPRNKQTESAVKTFVWGRIMFLRVSPNIVSFRAVNVHYRIFGQGQSGWYKHQRVTFSNEFTGRLTRWYVCAVFDGTPIF